MLDYQDVNIGSQSKWGKYFEKNFVRKENYILLIIMINKVEGYYF